MKLSTTMRMALAVIAENGGEVECRPGGFWTYPGALANGMGVPKWYAGTNTIRALATRGALALRTVPPRTFASHGTITDAGRQALAGGGIPSAL
ncbi:MAG: hypothetical protein ACHQQR_04375 [Gemmatimonadales bacterium]